MDSPTGLLLIDKPAGISSFDIIRRLRRQTGLRKFGHAGTLDPMATGLMLILVGSATKQAGDLSRLDKTYEATLKLGATSSTGDAEGEISAFPVSAPTGDEIINVLAAFKGEITQTPSKFSAIKVGGTRAYKLARAGKAVDMPPRQVIILALELNDYKFPFLSITTSVSSGTYIRSLAEDIGQRLGTNAYLTRLRRTRVGNYELKRAHELDSIDRSTLEAKIEATA